MNKKTTAVLFCVMFLFAGEFLFAGVSEAEKHSKTTTDKVNNETDQGDESAESSKDSSEESDETALGIKTVPIDAASYKTSTLFTTTSVIANANTFDISVYNGNVYAIYALPGDASDWRSKRMMVAKVPFSGSGAVTHPLVAGTDNKVRGYCLSPNNHKTWVIAVDRAGYIHVSGDMHSYMDMGYWRSDKPEDVSSFTQIEWEKKPPGTPRRCPISSSTTFPSFYKDRKGQLFWSARQSSSFLPFCSYDETTKLWTALGGPGFGKAGGICLAWTKAREYDGPSNKGGFQGSSLSVVWDSKNRLHMAIGMLDKSTHGPHPAPGLGTDILYAYSDDGGKTAHRADGTRIQYPIRASSGPSANRGDIILEEMSDPEYRWLHRHAGIYLDKADRPMIAVNSYTTGRHYFRLESRHWVEHPDGKDLEVRAPDPKSIIDALHLRVWKNRFDKNYFRDTGELVWVSVEGYRAKATYTVHRTVFNGEKK
jgi:hypothetical protein